MDHLRSNIEGLSIDLSDEDILEIESTSPFDFGYPHSLMSGARHKQISSGNPAFTVKMCGAFEGVSDGEGKS